MYVCVYIQGAEHKTASSGSISLVTGLEIADRKVKAEKDGKNTEILRFNS